MVHGKQVYLQGGGEVVVLIVLNMGAIGCLHEILQDVRRCPDDNSI